MYTATFSPATTMTTTTSAPVGVASAAPSSFASLPPTGFKAPSANINVDTSDSSAALVAKLQHHLLAPIHTQAASESINANSCSETNTDARSSHITCLGNPGAGKSTIGLALNDIVLGEHTPRTLAELIKLNPTRRRCPPCPPCEPPQQNDEYEKTEKEHKDELKEKHQQQQHRYDYNGNYGNYGHGIESDAEGNDQGQVEADAAFTQYCHALNDARAQIVLKLRGQLDVMRKERRRTQTQLRKLQAIRRRRAARSVIGKPMLKALKNKHTGKGATHTSSGGVGVCAGVGVGPKMKDAYANGLANELSSMLQLSMSSVSSACTDADPAHLGNAAGGNWHGHAHDKHHNDTDADTDEWMANSSPLSREDESMVSDGNTHIIIENSSGHI